MLFCKCLLPDGSIVDVTIGRDALGADLLHSVCDHMNIQDRDLVGLVHKDGGLNPSYNWWVRSDKQLRHQKKGECYVWVFALLIKFYPKRNFEKLEDSIR